MALLQHRLPGRTTLGTDKLLVVLAGQAQVPVALGVLSALPKDPPDGGAVNWPQPGDLIGIVVSKRGHVCVDLCDLFFELIDQVRIARPCGQALASLLGVQQDGLLAQEPVIVCRRGDEGLDDD